jgi:DNA-binding PadR family transcriptional regulator
MRHHTFGHREHWMGHLHSWPGYDFAGRRHGRHGSGRFAGGFAGDLDRDGHSFRSGRKLSSDDLQLVILALIQEKPRHGYEIIKALEELSRGFYVPSPGIVYPSLTYLEEAGHAAVEAEGARKLYRPTEAGSAYLAKHREIAEAILSQIENAGLRMEAFRQHFAAEESADWGRGRHGRHRGGDAPLLRHARAALRAALYDLQGATAEEEARIVEILDRATAGIREILSKRTP